MSRCCDKKACDERLELPPLSHLVPVKTEGKCGQSPQLRR